MNKLPIPEYVPTPVEAWRLYLRQSVDNKYSYDKLLSLATVLEKGGDHKAKYCGAWAYLEACICGDGGVAATSKHISTARKLLRGALNQVVHEKLDLAVQYHLALDTMDLFDFKTLALQNDKSDALRESASTKVHGTLRTLQEIYKDHYPEKQTDDVFGHGEHGFITEGIVLLSLLQSNELSANRLVATLSTPWQDSPMSYDRNGQSGKFDIAVYDISAKSLVYKIQVKHRKSLGLPYSNDVIVVSGEELATSYNKANAGKVKVPTNIIRAELTKDLLDFMASKILEKCKSEQLINGTAGRT